MVRFSQAIPVMCKEEVHKGWPHFSCFTPHGIDAILLFVADIFENCIKL